MEEKKYKRKSILIVCNILLTLLLLLTTAVTITLAIQQFNMNIGGDITFNATDVQATISAGQISNGTVADSTSKMQQIVLTPEDDGALEKATWEGLEITFNGLDDVIISFTVTNNHTESNLKMSLTTSSIDANNMTISTKIDNSNKTSVVIPKQAEGNDNKVDCQIIFHVESNLTSANIEGFSIEYTFANTDEEPTYAVAIDPSVSSMVTGVSLDSAEKGEQVTVTANIQDTVTDDYVIMSDGPLYYIENGSVEKVTINQIEGQYSFTMPANDITIGVEKYRRLDDFTFEGNAITGYTGSDTELILPSYYETVSINSQDYTVEKNTGTQITEIGNDAFSDCISINSVIIPEGVNSIGMSFTRCSNLKSVTLPKSLTTIGTYAFSNTNLSKINYNGNIEDWIKIEIGRGSDDSYANLFSSGAGFYIDNQLVTEINITSDVSAGVFSRYYFLQKITIAENINIGEYAFANSGLNEVVIEENVTSVSGSAFQKCYSLAIVYNNSSLDIIAGSPDNGNVGRYAYEVVNAGEEAQGRIEEINNVNYYVNGTTKVALFMVDRTASSVTLEEDTTAINLYAFFDCKNLTSITIPANVTEIGEWAFNICYSLTSVTIESDDIYNGAIGTDAWSHAGGLLQNATTVKVLKTIVDGEGNVNDYLNNESNFTKTTQGADDLYYTYTKINNI